MKVPLSWLREFVEVPAEPRRIADDLTAIGLAVDGIASDGRDTVFELDVTTNRVDCMNVYGVARELAARYGLPLAPLALDLTEAGEPAERVLDVRLEAPELCPRFSARVLEVRLGPSPAWLRDRLEQVGVRPINNVVDLTNYVMMEMGQPSHAFDLSRVPGAALLARWARPGEKVTTLDGVERALPASPRIGVVACPEAPLAIAGVMGGASSEVGDETRLVALEAAYWDPLSIRRAAKALGLHTEASHRFERGADPKATALATARIAHLLERIGAGRARPGVIDRVAGAPGPRRATLRPARVERLLGVEVPAERAATILTRLGFGIERAADGALEVAIPSWRGDVAREADLIEEVGRHHGLDAIPPTLPRGASEGGLRRAQSRERLVRQALAGAGLDEVLTLSFLPEPLGFGEGPPAPRLRNPLAEDQAQLRRSLVVPGLLASLQANLRHGRRDVRIFEIGRVFLADEGRVREERRLGILLAGDVRPGHWSEAGRPADFFDLKGLLAALAERLDLPPFELSRKGCPSLLHPGQSATLRLSGEAVGWLGALAPDRVASADLKLEPYVAELRLDLLLNAAAGPVRVEAVPRQPAVARDLSVLCDAGAESGELVALALRAGGPVLRSVTVADRYQGAPVPEGRVSLMLALRYQDPTRTLTGEEVERSVAAVAAALRAAGAEIRGE